ncbi:cuticle protein 10.9-like [Haemaphysalis longicornis]
MIAKVVIASLLACAFAEGPYGFQGNFYRGLQGPLEASAATPDVSLLDPVYPPQPYSFGYDNTDEFGTRIYHNEQSDASNTKTGSYGYRDEYGIFRRVNYVADANGFRATIDTNEPGTAAGRSADAVFNANPVAAPVRAKSAASAPIAAYLPAPVYGGKYTVPGARPSFLAPGQSSDAECSYNA